MVDSKRNKAMKGLLGVFFLLFLLMATISAAYADCTKDGKSYPEGSVVGGYVCENGKWVRR
jgi:hypothetical protein